MPEAEEEKKDLSENTVAANNEAKESGVQSASYYYDDAHGYEDFDPEHDEKEAGDSAS